MPVADGHSEERGDTPPDDDLHQVREAVAGLPERQWMVLFLRYYADLDSDPFVGADLPSARRRVGLTADYLKMFTARAATSRIVSAESADSKSIKSFASRVSGSTSVGLNAIAFVNAT